MKKIILLLSLLFIFSCNSDNNSITNGFLVNGDAYSTDFAYSNQTVGYHYTTLIISSSDRYASDFLEHRARLNIQYNGDQLEPGTYKSFQGMSADGLYGIVSFYENIEKIDGSLYSLGDKIAYAEYIEYPNASTESFKNGKVIVNSVEYNQDGYLEYVDLNYNFSWNGISINGNYKGEVRFDP